MLTHSTWVDRRPQAYGRLAFLGDSVLGLTVAEEIFRRFPQGHEGRLTKVHGQAVSGRACAEVAFECGLDEMLMELGPPDLDGAVDVATLLASERAMASIMEAAIGACYLEFGFERTSEATAQAFEGQIQLASETMLDFKSALQERLARKGVQVVYSVAKESGPPHDRRFEVEAIVEGEVLGSGEGRTKKAAEQIAASAALEALAN
jgi:ribonuclease-3